MGADIGPETGTEVGDAAPGDTGPGGGAATARGAAELSAVLLRAVCELLTTLDGPRIADLAAGRARLALVPATSVSRPGDGRTAPAGLAESEPPARRTSTPAGRTSTPAGRTSTPAGRASAGAGRGGAALPAGLDVAALRRSLLDAPGRAEAERILGDLGRITVVQLRGLAAALGIEGVGGRDTKATVLRRIVDGTVGLRLRSEAMFGGEHGT